MKDIFVWQFWIGMIFGAFFLQRLISLVTSKLKSV